MSFLKKAATAAATGGFSLLLGGGGDGGSAPQVDPLVGQNARTMSSIGNSQYAWAKDTNARIAPMFDQLTGAASGIGRDSATRSDALWQTYSDAFAPVNDQVAADAMGWDSPDALERAAGEASATVGKTYAQSAGRRGAMMAKYGINPRDALQLGEMANLQQATDEATAANAAREGRRNMAVQMRSGASQVGQGIASTAMGADQLALSGTGAAANIAATGVNTQTAAVDSAMPWLTGSNSALLGVNQQQMSSWQASQQASQARAAGIGQLLGTLGGAALGGPVGASIGGSIGKTVATPTTPAPSTWKFG